MKKNVTLILLSSGTFLLAGTVIFLLLYESRLKTISTIRKVTSYDNYNLYTMNVTYPYDLNAIIERGITDDQSMIDGIVREALPFLPVSIKVPSFGCSAFTLTDTGHNVLMGRNYDFRYDTSALLVHCIPETGYESIAFAALDNIAANDPQESLSKRLVTLTAPFICLDGMNEKGVSIAVLTLDSDPVHQQTGKPVITTTLAIRLVLDQAATTQEAVDLLRQYDMLASGDRDYHFYITDASGDGRAVEYDCLNSERVLVDTPVRTVTNFYALYENQALPDQRNGIYGHGRERYDRMETIFMDTAAPSEETAWQALKAASQLPSEESITSNTQWSIVYNDTALTADVVIRRDWAVITSFRL